MKKRLVLRKEIKVMLNKIGIILYIILMIGLMIYGADRFKKIDNGEIKVVSQTEMAERK